jgi:hypothetical protein
MTSVTFIAYISFLKDFPVSNSEDVQHQSADYEYAARTVHALISSVGGKIIGCLEGEIIAELPIDRALILKTLQDRLNHELHLPAFIGVGDDVQQAKKAKDYLENERRSGVKVYEALVEPKPEEDSWLEDSRVFSGLFEKAEDLNKADPSYHPIDKSLKIKALRAIQTVNENKSLFNAMKQQAPEIYGAIVGVVKALSAMVQQDQVEKEQYAQDSEKEVNKHLDKCTDSMKKQNARLIEKIIKQLMAEEHDGSNSTDSELGNRGSDLDGGSDDGYDYFDEDHDGLARSEHDTTLQSLEETKRTDSDLRKAELSEEDKQQIGSMLNTIQEGDDTLEQVGQANPEALQAIDFLIDSLRQIVKDKTGEDPVNFIHADQASKELDSQQEQASSPNVESSASDPIHRHKQPFAPGTIRTHDGKTMMKKPDGTWVSVSHKAKTQVGQ